MYLSNAIPQNNSISIYYIKPVTPTYEVKYSFSIFLTYFIKMTDKTGTIKDS